VEERRLLVSPPSHTAPRGSRKPRVEELQHIAQAYGFDLSLDEAASFQGLMGGMLASCRRLEQFVEPTPPVNYPRDAGHRPTAEENRLNA
jgi:amidase